MQSITEPSYYIISCAYAVLVNPVASYPVSTVWKFDDLIIPSPGFEICQHFQWTVPPVLNPPKPSSAKAASRAAMSSASNMEMLTNSSLLNTAMVFLS